MDELTDREVLTALEYSSV